MAVYEQIASLMLQGRPGAEAVRTVCGIKSQTNSAEKAYRITRNPYFVELFYSRLQDMLSRNEWSEDQVILHWKAVSDVHLLLFMKRGTVTQKVKMGDEIVEKTYEGWILRDDIEELPDDVLRCVQSIKMDDNTGLIREIKLKDSLKASELLAKAYGMMIERVAHTSDESLADEIRERLAKMEQATTPASATIN